MSAIPDRWLKYRPIGDRISGTRFIAFKVPLREQISNRVDERNRLDGNILIERIPNLGLIIDLTNTTRYYSPSFYEDKGINHYKLMIPGRRIPSIMLIRKFKDRVADFLKTNGDNDKLIGVHCTHGVNRTGFLIANYMISEMSISAEKAIEQFGLARGHNIERVNYLAALRDNISNEPLEQTNDTRNSPECEIPKAKKPRRSAEPHEVNWRIRSPTDQEKDDKSPQRTQLLNAKSSSSKFEAGHWKTGRTKPSYCFGRSEERYPDSSWRNIGRRPHNDDDRTSYGNERFWRERADQVEQGYPRQSVQQTDPGDRRIYFGSSYDRRTSSNTPMTYVKSFIPAPANHNVPTVSSQPPENRYRWQLK